MSRTGTEERYRQNVRNGIVECEVHSRWLRFPRNLGSAPDDDLFTVYVMTGNEETGEQRKLCELVLSKRSILDVLTHQEQPPLDREALANACFAVANTTTSSAHVRDVEAIEALAKKFLDTALGFEEFLVDGDRDPNILVRAVRYIERTHAIPPMGEDTSWFYEVLNALLELAAPNAIGRSEHEGFMRDLEDGIGIFRTDYEKEPAK